MRPSAFTLAVILLPAALLRFVALGAGIPFNIGVDEPEIMSRVVQMMRTGDFNPHFFDYPGLYFYVQLGVAVLRFLAGATSVQWSALDQVEHSGLLPVGARGHRAPRHADGAARLPHRHAMGRAPRRARGRPHGRHATARPRIALRADRRAGHVLRHADAAAHARRARTGARGRLRLGWRRGGSGRGHEIPGRPRPRRAAHRGLDDAWHQAVAPRRLARGPRRRRRRISRRGSVHHPGSARRSSTATRTWPATTRPSVWPNPRGSPTTSTCPAAWSWPAFLLVLDRARPRRRPCHPRTRTRAMDGHDRVSAPLLLLSVRPDARVRTLPAAAAALRLRAGRRGCGLRA